MLKRAAILLSPLLLLACRDGLGVPEDEPRADLGSASDLASSPCTAHLDLESCQADARCVANACDICGEVGFAGCYDKDDAPWFGCPAIACDDCASHGTQIECDQDPACASSYREGGLCLCDGPGCCMTFDRCLTRADVKCAPSDIGPQCGQPEFTCPEAYATVYDGTCEVGCVAKDICFDDYDCRDHGCQIGYTCQLCWTHYTCMQGGNSC